MVRTLQKVESLIAEDPAMADAIRVVLDASDGGAHEIEWADVRDDLTSGQWGRLIEKGVLVDGDTGFRVRNPDDVRAALDEESGTSTGSSTAATASATSSDDDDDDGWSKWDKLAAVGSVALFAGYSIGQVRNAIGGIMDVFLGPIDAALPFYVVVLILSLVTGLYSTLLQANLMDMEKMGEYQQRMKDIQERRKAAKERGDDAAMQKIQEEQMEAMGDQMGMFKAQFRPMVWIMLITIPVFLWMYWMILEPHIATSEMQIVLPLIGETTWRDHVLGPMQAWIIWYFLCSMGFTQIIRKALNIQTSPT